MLKINAIHIYISLRYCFLALLIFYPFLCKAQDVENLEEPVITTKYYLIKKHDTLFHIAQSFDLGKEEILRANPEITNPEFIYSGQKIILPTTHLLPDAKPDGIVINLAEMRLYFFLDDTMGSFPISVGSDEKTPLGKTKIADKRENPSWIPPESIRKENPELPKIVLPGPDNPLGNYALYLDASHNYKWQGIMIHGTNVPQSIGSRVSHGCIRLYPQDIKALFYNVEIGTGVEIINQPIKVNEINEEIYLEIHIREEGNLLPENFNFHQMICKKVNDCDTRINWKKVNETVMQNLGIPVNITAN